MRIARFRAFASYKSFVITDRFDYMEDVPSITEDCCRRGYLVHRPNIVYHYIRNELWQFALSIDLCETAPTEFGDAERVIHLPVVLSGQMLLNGSGDWQESSFRKLPVGAGRYSLFSMGWNLGAENMSSEAEEADDDSIWSLPDIERYEWVICPMVDEVPRVLRVKSFYTEQTINLVRTTKGTEGAKSGFENSPGEGTGPTAGEHCGQFL